MRHYQRKKLRQLYVMEFGGVQYAMLTTSLAQFSRKSGFSERTFRKCLSRIKPGELPDETLMESRDGGATFTPKTK